jgi:N-succinyldiaminopimelate aminotransferase
LHVNRQIALLQPYPFERLAVLLHDLRPPPGTRTIDLSIGEPKHQSPPFILEAAQRALAEAARYPSTRGSTELRMCAAAWLERRFSLPAGSIDPERSVLPVCGTREALFTIAQCLIDRCETAELVIMPNPLYQIYEGAALLAGAEPRYVNCLEPGGFVPDFSAVSGREWQRCRLLYLCTPGNPAGAVLSSAMLAQLLELADRHDFVIASDECYSEIYADESHPPAGLLQAAAALGRADYRRCLVFHSLSKRSNVPGLRSGFVAGDPELLAVFHRYRTYHGCTMAPFVQAASAAAWNDEAHVAANRAAYREKFSAVLEILQPVMNVSRPEGGFYLWPQTPVSDQEFAGRLYSQHNVIVLPGSFIGRTQDGVNPGANRLRMALVADLDDCIAAAHAIRSTLNAL